MTESLDAATLRLRGSGLIEASAGTGKTWTLAALYLRLVLGHGDAVQREQRPLLPGEILVMTFTRAATRELNDRIRRRLVETAAVFRGLKAASVEDAFVQRLLADHPEGPARQAAAWRLESAAQAMDEAAIHTLDAWCQRVLREHAFDSDAPMDHEVLPDGSSLRQEAARDVWRQEVYPLDAAALRAVRELWHSPDEMAADVQLVGERQLPGGDPAQNIARIVEDSLQDLAELKAGWEARADEMEDWLRPLLTGGNSPFNAVSVNWEKVQDWTATLRNWAQDPVMETLDLNDTARKRLRPPGLLDAVKKKFRVPTPPECFDDFELLMQALDRYRTRASRLRAYAASRVIVRMQQLKATRRLHSHADVQQRLHDALDSGRHGERALRLREQLLAQYPAALIDEFQDTSPVQLGILDRLYRIAEDESSRLLLLIGDPKQSIYGFRGADIHSYLQARQATEGRHHVLGVNHRSTQGAVAAVNAVFQAAEQRSGEGAFRFGGPGAAQRLPFEPVRAQGRAEQLLQRGQPLPALQLCVDPELRSSTEARSAYARRCAQAIVQMLTDADTGFASTGEGGPAMQALRPRDIAVLVRSHREAAEVRLAMAQRGLPSVFLSDRDSVFDTGEAADLLRCLNAVAAPRDARRVRAALATDLLGFSLPQLQALADDDEAFETQAERLARLQTVWQVQGVLAMVRTLLHGFNLPARWLRDAEGERRLTNVLHLAELLQAAALHRDTPAALLRWLANQIQDPQAESGSSEERVLRLESDADRVQVVTVHKSKGLEYPVVFLPFATHFRDERRHPPWALWLVDDDGTRRVALEPTAEDRALALREQQREDVRLLYVALTRARHHLWVGASMHRVGNGKECVWHRSALGYLLTGETPQTPDQILPVLSALSQGEPAVALDVLTPATDPVLQPLLRWQARQHALPLAPAPVYEARFDRQWAVSSYSALVRDAVAPAAASVTLPPDAALGWVGGASLRDDEWVEAASPLPALPSAEMPGSDDAPWHRFPRGAFAGNFLHDQLEWLAGEGFALQGQESTRAALARRCDRGGWGHRAADVDRWLSEVCHRPLPPLQQSLSGLTARLPEMEFWLPDDGLDVAALDRLCQQHLMPGRARPALVERQLRGLLMGFADLVFEHQGRYWVLDYKSNALGTRDADYTEAAMQRAMLEHRYDVQAVLYLLPLHRLLRSRLGAAYLPQRHLGGAIYLFLRGIAAPGAGCLTLSPPWPLLEALDAQLPAGSGPGAEA